MKETVLFDRRGMANIIEKFLLAGDTTCKVKVRLDGSWTLDIYNQRHGYDKTYNITEFGAASEFSPRWILPSKQLKHTILLKMASIERELTKENKRRQASAKGVK